MAVEPLAAAAGGGINPLSIASGVGAGLGALGGLFAGDTPDEKFRKFQLEQFKKLFPALQRMIQSGSVIGGGRKQQLIGRQRVLARPQEQKLFNEAIRRFGFRNPEALRFASTSTIPQAMQFGQQLEMADVGQLADLRKLLFRSTF